MTILLYLLAIPAAVECIPLDSERIEASQLAARIPALAQLPPTLSLGFAPIPGARRTIAASELNAALRKHGAPPTVAEGLCVERASSPLQPEELAAAMRAAFQGRDVQIEILEYVKRGMGKGAVEFQTATLTVPLRDGIAVIWRGVHRDSSAGRATPIWARVKLTEKTQALFATQDLPAGKAIANGAVEVRETVAFPAPRPAPVDHREGWIPRRTLRAGQKIDPAWLDPPVAVARGEAVTVDVLQEGMKLSLTGRAANAARVGQKLAVTMPLSKRTFQAVVKENGHAVIEVPTPRR